MDLDDDDGTVMMMMMIVFMMMMLMMMMMMIVFMMMMMMRMRQAPLHSRKKAGSRDPGSRTFLAQIRKVEARLGKLTKIRKVETD